MQLHWRSFPQPFAGFVTLHSAFSPFVPVPQAAAGVQHVPLGQERPAVQLPAQLTIVPAGRHEFCTDAHAPAAWPAQVCVGAQHVPGVPFGGAFAGEPVALFTQMPPFGHVTLMLLTPQPFASAVPH